MTTAAATARCRRSCRRRAAACALLLLVALARPVAAAPAPRVVTADLRGNTTISWSGNAAIRLRVAKDVLLPEDSAYRLILRTGRFVAIRAFPNPQPIGCRRDYQVEWCAGVWMDWLRDLAETGQHWHRSGDPARGMIYGLNDPPIVLKGGWDLYLFTDGRATLEITARGLPGRASYVAAGRFSGQAVFGKGPCRLPACSHRDPAYADQRYGGAAFDVGRVGFAQAMAYGAMPRRDLTPAGGANQQFALRSCMYPNRDAPQASSDPAAHPTGCDAAAPSHAKDSALGTVSEVSWLSPGAGGVYYGGGSYDARGRVYLGFRAGSAGHAPPRLGGLLIFLRYGIR